MGTTSSRYAFWSRRLGMGWASVILGVSILISRFMGLARDKIISYLFGATQESDIYFAAFVIPDFINYLLAGAYFSITLIPLLAAYFDRSEEEGWRFFSAASFWVSLSITLLTAAAMVFAPELARMATPGITGTAHERLTFFLRIVMPAQVFFLSGSCITALLYLRKQFIVPALTPLIYNSMIILGGVLLRQRGMEGFCWGVLAGAFLGNFFLPCLAAHKGGGLKLRLSLYHPGLKRFLLLALPLMLGQSIVVLDEQLTRVFGSLAGTGAISWLNYARRIMLVPVGVVAQAAGVASYPFLSELVARREIQRFHSTLNHALRSTLTLLIPLSLWMITISGPTVRLIFEQGHFAHSDTLQTARLLMIFLAVVACWGFQQILGRAYYARQDTLTPAVLGTLTTVASLPLFYLLTRSMQATGVALASALSVTLYSAFLSLWWRRRFGAETFRGLGRATLQLTVLSLSAAIPAVYLARLKLFHSMDHPYTGALGAILSSGAAFAFVFGILSIRFIPELVRPFLEKGGPLTARLVRDRAAPGR